MVLFQCHKFRCPIGIYGAVRRFNVYKTEVILFVYDQSFCIKPLLPFYLPDGVIDTLISILLEYKQNHFKSKHYKRLVMRRERGVSGKDIHEYWLCKKKKDKILELMYIRNGQQIPQLPSIRIENCQAFIAMLIRMVPSINEMNEINKTDRYNMS